MYSSNILIANFQSDVEILTLQYFSIYKVTLRNWGQVLKKFPGYRIQDCHYIQRDYPEVSPDPRNPWGLGRIPSASEDLMLLLRLFKLGDLCFRGQVTQTPEGLHGHYPYPQAFSDYHSTQTYSLNSAECTAFDTFFTQAPSWFGWNSSWFKISRRYFLWGSSKAFNIMRERIEEWELERILDFFIALEAALVPENDFVGRRLRERAAALLNLDKEASKVFKKRLTALYRVRSTIAHGAVIEESQVVID